MPQKTPGTRPRGSERRRRPSASAEYSLTPETAREAVVEFLRLVLESEDRASADVLERDRYRRRTMFETTGGKAALGRIVNILLTYRESRRERALTARTSVVSKNIAARTPTRRAASRVTATTQAAEFEAGVRKELEWWADGQIPDVDVKRVVQAALYESRHGKLGGVAESRFVRIASAVSRISAFKQAKNSPRTQESILAALASKKPATGSFRDYDEAEAAVLDEPPARLEMLAIALDALLPAPVGTEVLEFASDAIARFWRAREPSITEGT